VADQPYTEADVKLAISAVHMANCTAKTGLCELSPAERATATAVVEVLAAAGRLLPEGARTVEQLGVRVDREHPRRKEKVGEVMKIASDFLTPISSGMQPCTLGRLDHDRSAQLDEQLRGLGEARQRAAVESRTFVVVHRG
jgi:hypothetical protein